MATTCKIKLFLFLCSIFNLVEIGTCVMGREVEFNHFVNDNRNDTDNIKIGFDIKKGNIFVVYNLMAVRSYSFMHDLQDGYMKNPAIEHVILFIGHLPAKVANIAERQRETELRAFYGGLEGNGQAKNGLKVRTLYLNNFLKVANRGAIIGQSINYHWKNFNEKPTHLCVSTFGIEDELNIQYSYIDDAGVKHFLPIYENPFLRNFYKTIKDKEKYCLKLTREMAEEYPVPLPALAKQSEQQKRFQVDDDVDELHRQQIALLNEITAASRLTYHHYKQRRDEIQRSITEFQQKNLDPFPAGEFLIESLDGKERLVMPIKRVIDGDQEYIPDDKFKEYTFLEDTSSTKFVLFVMMPYEKTQQLDSKDNEVQHDNIYKGLKMLKSDIFEVKLIHVRKFSFGARNCRDFATAFSFWMDAHRQKADKREPINYAITFGIDETNDPIKDITGRSIAIYENLILRLCFSHIVLKSLIPIGDEMVRDWPLRDPNIVVNDPNQKDLRKKLRTETGRLLKEFETKMKDTIESTKATAGSSKATAGLSKSQSTGNVDETNATKREHGVSLRQKFKFIDQQELASRGYTVVVEPSTAKAISGSSGQSKPLKIIDETHATERDYGTLLNRDIDGRLTETHLKILRAQWEIKSDQIQKQIKEKQLKASIVFIVDDLSGTEPIKMPIHLAPNDGYVYIPDPDVKYSKYKYLKDETSTKNVLFVTMEIKEKDELDTNVRRKNNIYGHLGKIQKKWPNYEIRVIYVMGLENCGGNFAKIFSYWIDAHRQTEDSRQLIDQISIFGFEETNEIIKDLINRNYVLYECSHLRYNLLNLDGHLLEPTDELISKCPLLSPAELRKTPEQKKLQENLSDEVLRLTRIVRNEVLQIIADKAKGKSSPQQLKLVDLTKPQGEQGKSKTSSPSRASDQTQRPNELEKALRAHPRDPTESHYGDGASSGKRSRRE